MACLRSCVAWAAFAIVALAVRPSFAADGDELPHGAPVSAKWPITLERAIASGAERAPAVAEASRTRAAASAFARRPGGSLPSVPRVSLLAGARKPVALPLGPEGSVTVEQDIAARALGSARRRAAEWTARVAAHEVDRARLEGALTAALAWLDLLEAQELSRLREAALADAARLEAIADVRVASGVATAAEKSLAIAESGAVKLSILEAEGRATEARLALALAIGAPFDRYLAADGPLEGGDGDGADAPALASRPLSHPASRAAEARARQRAAEAEVARAATGPMFSLGATAWREGSGDHAAAAIVSVPLPLFEPSRHEVGRQETLAAAEAARADRLKSELELERRLALHEREHAREVRDSLRTGLVDPLRRAASTAFVAYSAGTSDLGVVLLARRSALAAEERLVSALVDVKRAEVRAAAISGTLLSRAAR